MPKLGFASAFALLLGAAALEAQTCVPHLLGADRRGPAEALSRTGSTLYVGTGAALAVIDVTDRSQPVERGFVNLESIVRDVAAAGSTAVVLAASGLLFVDSSEPDQPSVIGSWPIPAEWGARNVAARGSLALIPAADGVHLIDFAEPANAVEVGFLPLPYSRDVVTSGEARAYVVAYRALHVVDISEPSEPSIVTSVTLPGDTDEALAIGPNGGRLMTWGNFWHHHSWGYYTLFDLSDPDQPELRWTSDFDTVILSATLAGDRAYVEGAILDISNLAQPEWRGELPAEDPSEFAVTGDPGLLYVADRNRGIVTMDVSHPTSAGEVHIVPLPTSTVDGYVAGDDAVLLERSGIRVASLVDPSRPLSVGALRLSESWLFSVIRVKSHALVNGWFDDNPYVMRFVDLTDPTEPALAATVPTLTDRNSFVDEDLLFAITACDGGETVVVYDVSAPGVPILLSEVGIAEECTFADFAGDGDRLYVWHYVGNYPDGDYRLSVLDVSVPTAPVELGTSAGTHWGSSVARGNRLVLTEDERLDVLDLVDPATPVLRGSVSLRSSRSAANERVSLYGSRAALPRRGRDADGNTDDRPSVVDLSDPSAPFEWAALDTPGTAESIFFGPGVVVVADGVAGYSIFESCIPFADGFESGDTSEWSPPAP